MTQLAHGKKLEPLAESVRRLVLRYKKRIKTIPLDNDPEFATHKFITKSLGAFIYFAAPYASSQRRPKPVFLFSHYIPHPIDFALRCEYINSNPDKQIFIYLFAS